MPSSALESSPPKPPSTLPEELRRPNPSENAGKRRQSAVTPCHLLLLKRLIRIFTDLTRPGPQFYLSPRRKPCSQSKQIPKSLRERQLAEKKKPKNRQAVKRKQARMSGRCDPAKTPPPPRAARSRAPHTPTEGEIAPRAEGHSPLPPPRSWGDASSGRDFLSGAKTLSGNGKRLSFRARRGGAERGLRARRPRCPHPSSRRAHRDRPQGETAPAGGG